jgi:Concanavalin A-like lectin/glucanases superfamily
MKLMIPFQSFRLIVLTLLWLAPAAWAQTPFGNAITLNGTNQYIVVTNFGNIIPTNEVTVEFWANTTVATGQSAFILNPDSNANRFNAHVNYGTPPAQGVIYWDFGNINSGVGRLGPNNAPVNSISNWVHYAFVASQSGNSMSIYTNGVLLATKSGMTPFVRGTYDLDIGGGSNYFSYHGSLDDFRVWNTALSQAQIQANLGVPLTGSEANLVVYYRFDNTGGTVATNSATATGTLYNGAIMGGAPLVASGVSTAAFLNSVVTSTADNGPGSLRQTVTNALPGSAITFTNTLSGQTILLTSGQIEVSNNVTIDASALPKGIAINGNASSHIFQVDASVTVVLDALTITNGSDPVDGNAGGIYNFGTLTVNLCKITGNASSYWGGGINNRGTMIVNQCTISANTALFACGIENQGMMTLNQSTVSGHSAAAAVGGIDNLSGTLTLNNSTVAGNSCTDTRHGAGGIWNRGSTLTLNNSTIANNSAPVGDESAGGIINDATLNMTNSVVAGNTNGSGLDIYNSATIALGGGNIIQAVTNDASFGGGTVTGSAAITNAPLLAALGNYGGSTQTMPPLAGSPAINAGSDAVTNYLATDQRGHPRLSGPHVDIGAVEVQSPAANPPVLGNIALSGGSGTGNFQFAFNNAANADFTVLTATNLVLPLTNWTVLGEVMQPASGQYQFTDPQAATNAMRFYRVVSP